MSGRSTGAKADDLSIVNQAANIPEGFPATNLVEVLLRHIGVDTSKFVRNVQSSIQVYFRSSKIYNTVLFFIQQTQNSNTAEWVAFDRYTLAIPILERYSSLTPLQFAICNLNLTIYLKLR